MAEKKVRTVLGDIRPEEMGYTSLHDHAFLDMRPTAAFMESIMPPIPPEQLEFRPENYSFLKDGMFLLCKDLQVVDDLDGLTKEYRYFAALGGQTVVETTPSALRGAPIGQLAELSRRTGLHFICATGLYHETAIPPELRGHDTEYYYAYMKKEIDDGIQGTEIRPGLLKCALNQCSDTERHAMEACMRLSAETGLSIHIHTEPTTKGEDILSLLDQLAGKYAVPADRIHICHMDSRLLASTPVSGFLQNPSTHRELDLDLQIRLLDKGFTIGLDTWGMCSQNLYMFMPDDFDRLKAVITLIDRGYGDQLTLGNDFAFKIRWRAYGGSGCTRFADICGQTMEALGRGAQYHKLVCENPMRIMSF